MATGGKVFANERARETVRVINADIQAAMYETPRQWPLRPPYRVSLYVPVKHRTDLDNAAGHPLDSLTKCGVITDDRDVAELTVKRHADDKIILMVTSL
jgi:Holliday junction resolvase RusA-like endonuclease